MDHGTPGRALAPAGNARRMAGRRTWVLLAAVLFVLPVVPGVGAVATQVGTISPGAGAFNGLYMTLADFRGDGHLEVVAQSDDGNVYVMDPRTDLVLATFMGGNAGCTTSCYQFEGVSGPLNAPVVADLDHTGNLDVIVANTAAVVARFSYDPAHSTATRFAFIERWEHRYNQYQSFTTMDATPVVADLRGDGKLEILVQTEENGVFAVKPDGTTLWSSGMAGGHSTPSVADLTGDGKPDIVVTGDDGVVTALLASSGTPEWSFDSSAYVYPASIPMAATLADINGDGHPDVLFIARDAHDATTFSNDHFIFFALDSWGHLLWREQPTWGAPLSHTRPIAVSVKGHPMVLGGDWNTIGHIPGHFERVGPGHVFLYDAKGVLRWRRDLNADASNTDLVVADAVGDGTQQVIVPGTRNGLPGLLVFDLATGADRAFLPSATPTRSHVVVGNLFGDGRFGMAEAVAANGGSLLVWHGSQTLSAQFPGWGALTIPVGTPGATGGGSAFAPTFQPKGNEWWVESKVTADRTVTAVTASVNGGPPVALGATSWGTWATSMHAANGSVVQFKATASPGETGSSPCYLWTAATPTSCAGPTPAGNFTVTLSPKGNEWWVEAVPSGATFPVASVSATVDGGPAVALPATAWGTWATSIHAPSGSVVQFAAHDAAGAAALSPCYLWITFATQPCSPSPPPAANMTATFLPQGGNGWWVQVRVTASVPLASVQAQVGAGAWHPLTLQSYGDWAASFQVPSGSSVTFQATSTTGPTATSPPFPWPS
ncbi:MAG: FG-GAP repeat domain-containing protein [Thermoplasmatota archaeon]